MLAFDRIIVHQSGDIGPAFARSATIFMRRLMKLVAEVSLGRNAQLPIYFFGGFLLCSPANTSNKSILLKEPVQNNKK